jgi:ABC-2 type transport system ATP-binding protein
MISVLGVTKQFGRREVLRGLDMQIPSDAVTLLVGSNGAGKTTLLRAICGLCIPDEGTVTIAGYNIAADRMRALSQLAFLPQAPRFHPRLTTLQAARYYGQLRGQTDTEVQDELERWGLLEHLHTTTNHLSGGLRQRLSLAIFAIARAPINVLDEPGLSLDPEWRQRLQGHLAERARSGATVLVATHLLAEWEGKVDRCILLEAGRVSTALDPNRLRAEFEAHEGKALT